MWANILRICTILDAFAKLQIETISFVISVFLSVRPSMFPSACSNLAKTVLIVIKFDIWVFFWNLCRKSKFHQNLTSITGTLHEGVNTIMIESRSVIIRMRNVSDKSCKDKTYISSSVAFFFRKACRLWDNVEKYGKAGQATDDNMA
jgi:hypothetical protein